MSLFAIDVFKKQSLIDQRIVLMHKIDDIDNELKKINEQEEAEKIKGEELRKLEYYKEFLEKDNPVPENYKAKDILNTEEIK